MYIFLKIPTKEIIYSSCLSKASFIATLICHIPFLGIEEDHVVTVSLSSDSSEPLTQSGMTINYTKVTNITTVTVEQNLY